MTPTPRAALATAVVAAAASLLSTSCSADSQAAGGGKVQIVTSTNVYADIAASVGGEFVDVTAFVSSPDQDPHSYEANTRNVLTVSQADVVVENGGGYDDFMDQLLETATSDPVVLNAVEVSGFTAPAGGELNEHVWYDLPTMQELASQIGDALADADPDHAEAYQANAEDFRARVQQLIDTENQLRRGLKGIQVGITEPVPGYLLKALGLVNATPPGFSEAIEEGEDVPVIVLDETLRLYTEHRVEALVYNEQTTGTTTEQVLQAAEDAGVAVVGVTETLPEQEDYISWMTTNVDRLDQALGGP